MRLWNIETVDNALKVFAMNIETETVYNAMKACAMNNETETL